MAEHTEGTRFEALREGADGKAPVVLLCEHASNRFPPAFGTLGLDAPTRESHIAWDPGALDLARLLSRRWSLPLVAGSVSRLIYDCNRPPESPAAIPEVSEIYEIPGNRGLSPEERARRVAAVYRPFVEAVSAAIEAAQPAALVTVHSFTPVYFGKPRAVEIGILHDSDARLAEALLARDWGGRAVGENAPYGPDDGVTHSLVTHAQSRGLANVMIEVRNDLLASPEGTEEIAALLARNLAAALSSLGIQLEEAA
ncbi:MAG: N-formylglutamate amidohydrolase [Alphaproteobacteria bacterium]|nr:MAG: N-formylglutamate amidohydrolase [Alphaproteobacteria bacterium]